MTLPINNSKHRLLLTNNFYSNIILPTLRSITFAKTQSLLEIEAAAELLLGTAIQESSLQFFKQKEALKPALGPYQMEEATFNDLHQNYLKYRKMLLDQALTASPTGSPSFVSLETDHKYATVIARFQYARYPANLPKHNDLRGQANYWKMHWNTYKGAGTIEKYMDNWDLFHDTSKPIPEYPLITPGVR